MIHYNVWFRFKDEVEESEGLVGVQGFLDELHATGEIAGFQLLKNTRPPDKSKMLPYQALIEFSDNAQFAEAFSVQAARGIHTGLHGRMLSVIGEVQIDVFEQLVASSSAFASAALGPYACEV